MNFYIIVVFVYFENTTEVHGRDRKEVTKSRIKMEQK